LTTLFIFYSGDIIPVCILHGIIPKWHFRHYYSHPSKSIIFFLQCAIQLFSDNDPRLTGNTALHMAAMRGDLTVVQEIIKKGTISLESRNLENSTPLHIAAKEGQIVVVK
jgi:ankyrin repeat protein